ncbi:hypothetical protein CYLTODRAFT_420632 [Cylindrobasidium torrendii FP15055 ss-10]|uniref:CsbD-like domain-containing protein n=1 Tax=Cylindrobasidium torrendii FP15055 ss-10 TaxID=1314674 RepID=A0A0D7BHB2_9AGAR|nr:hypothetical protein CYLTODRAFT_420632 [Cylindrobasidium torrendii FP15055 ss-10]
MSSQSTNTNSQAASAPQSTPSKLRGQYHSVRGTLFEAIGDALGWSSWSNSGRDEHRSGEAEIQAAEAKEFVQGAVDRFEGRKESVLGSILGDKARQTQGNAQEAKGKAAQRASS